MYHILVYIRIFSLKFFSCLTIGASLLRVSGGGNDIVLIITIQPRMVFLSTKFDDEQDRLLQTLSINLHIGSQILKLAS